MTHLYGLNSSQETSPNAVLQEQGAQSIQAESGKQVSRISESDFANKLAELNKLPLWDREWKIMSMRELNNIPVTLDMKLRFLQPVFEQKLREAAVYDDILKIFQQGAFHCFEGEEFNSQLFDSYIKPVIEQVAREREMHSTLGDFTMVLERSPSWLRRYLIEFLQRYDIFSPHREEGYLAENIKLLSEMFYSWCILDIHNTKELHNFCGGLLPITKIKFDYEMADADVVVIAEALGFRDTLTSLDFSWPTKIGDAGAIALVEALKVNNTLTTLNINAYEIGDVGAVALAGALKVNKTLTTLNLFHSKIGDAGILALADALEENETLTSLHFSGIPGNMSGDGVRALVKALTVNKTLTNLILDSVRLGTEGVVALAKALVENKTLRSLGLNSSHVTAKGARVLAGVLKVNETLTSLTLEGNNFKAEGAKALAEALKVNGTLTSLSLDSNEIDDESSKELADALKVNGSLTSLKLQDNKIGDAGAVALADALNVNRALTNLDLQDNKIGSIGVVMLAASREESDTRTSFHFKGNNIANSPKQFRTEISTFYKGSTFQF